jgi:signal transduction histidine kinase
MGDTRRHPANLADIIQVVIDMIQTLGRYRGKNVSFRGDQSIRAIVNPQEIKQVVLNLITNALDSVSQDGNVEIRLERKHENALLVISDDGCGMTDEVLQHLFEPFFTRKRDGQGTGLGLSITYQIIQEHGGSIVPASDGPGRGATFEVSLPVAKDEENKSRAELAA